MLNIQKFYFMESVVLAKVHACVYVCEEEEKKCH